MHTRFKNQSVASFTCSLMLLFYSWSSNLKAPDLTITPLTNIQHKFWVYLGTVKLTTQFKITRAEYFPWLGQNQWISHSRCHKPILIQGL